MKLNNWKHVVSIRTYVSGLVRKRKATQMRRRLERR